MTGDKRAYYKTDVGYFDNPKLADLVEDHPRAVILHLRAIAYCAQHLTDGVFPMRLVMRMACASDSDLQCLIDAGLIREVSGTEAEVHDYLEHQRSAAAVKKAKAAGQKGAAARWDAKGDADRIADRIPGGNATPNGQRDRRDRRDITTSASADAERETEFTEWYSHYPRKRGKGQALKAYKAARKKVAAETLLESIKEQVPLLTKRDPEHIPYPATWLNGESWDDDISPNGSPSPQNLSEEEFRKLPVEKRAEIMAARTTGHLQ